MSLLAVDQLVMQFGTRLIQKDISLKVEKGCIFAVMGGSGCGKSTLLKHLVGLLPPAAGTVTYDGVDFWASDDAQRSALRSRFGMLFQSAALWSSMTVARKRLPAAPRQTRLDASSARPRRAKCSNGSNWASSRTSIPLRLSGGMKKRAGLARAIAAEPRCCSSTSPRPASTRSARAGSTT